jgi:hypothetical protein
MITDKRLYALLILLAVGTGPCEKADVRMRVASGPTLTGPGVKRRATPPYFRERERYLLKGERVAGGCMHRVKARMPEWEVESEGASCTKIMARGDVIGRIEHRADNTVSAFASGPRNP